jgi:large subunit ribosomal protein L5
MAEEKDKKAKEAKGEGRPAEAKGEGKAEAKGEGKGKGKGGEGKGEGKGGEAKGGERPAQTAEQQAEAAAKKAARAQGKGKGKGPSGAPTRELATERVKRPAPARLRQLYDQEIRARLIQELGLSNRMQAPRLLSITVNMGLGEAVTNPKILDAAVEELAQVTGQHPVVTKAKKSIAVYKLRAGQKIGAMVTLRRDTMWEFFDRLVSFALPRVRDFKGVSPKAFDGRGNFTLGVREGMIFPEIVQSDRLEKPKGMNITITTSARNDEQGRALLRHLGMPFRS